MSVWDNTSIFVWYIYVCMCLLLPSSETKVDNHKALYLFTLQLIGSRSMKVDEYERNEEKCLEIMKIDDSWQVYILMPKYMVARREILQVHRIVYKERRRL